MTQLSPTRPDSLTPLAPPHFWKGRQSVHLDETFAHRSGAKVRLRIARDSVSFQSYALAEGFDPSAMKWNEIASIPASEMASRGLNGYEHPHDSRVQAALSRDSTTLLREVAQLLD